MPLHSGARKAGSSISYVTAALLSLALVAITGCTAGNSSARVTAVPQPAGLSGLIYGGQQPISGSTIQLWAVSTAGDGSGATPLVNTTITSGSNGNFDITGHYTCPTASTLVYLTANGGNPGLATGTDNHAIAFMAALGACGGLGASTHVFMNEVTTVGTIFALAPYMSSYNGVGSSNQTLLASAFSKAHSLVDVANGTPGGPDLAAGQGVDAKLIYTIADIIASCINSAGGVAGESNPCGSLFDLTGGHATTDVAGAALFMAQHPTSNTALLYSRIQPNAPYQDIYLTAPASYQLNALPQVAKPVFTPNGGTFAGTKTVTITDNTDGATILYTTDGTDPATSSTATTFNPAFPISIHATSTLQAIGRLIGDLDSDVASVTITITASTPPTSGIITTVAGNGTTTRDPYTGYGDGGPATAASFAGNPGAIAVDGSGNLFILDARVRKVTPDGTIRAYAGGGHGSPFYTAGVQPTDVSMNASSIAVDPAGNLYVADSPDGLVLKVTTDGTVSIVAGNGGSNREPGNPYGPPPPCDDGSQATQVEIEPYALAADSAGNLYMNEGVDGSIRIRKVSASGIITTLAGSCTSMSTYYSATEAPDGSLATSRPLYAAGLPVPDSAGNLFFLSYTPAGNRIRKIAPNGIVTTIAGNAASGPFPVDGTPALSASLPDIGGLAMDSTGAFYFTDISRYLVRKFTIGGTISTIAGVGIQGPTLGDGGPATAALFAMPTGLAFGPNGDLYIADSAHIRIRKISH